jgi:hypothetical protein
MTLKLASTHFTSTITRSSAFIEGCQADLAQNFQALVIEFMEEACLLDPFQQTGA